MCHWLPPASKHCCALVSSLLFPSPPHLWAHVCFCSPACLTHNDDLDQADGKVKVGWQIASKQSASSLSANSVSSLFLSPSCHHSITPSLHLFPFSSYLSLCLPGGGDVCQGGLAAGSEGGGLPCFEVSALTGG